MSASDRLRASAGANISRSIGRQSGVTVAASLAAPGGDRHAGLSRVRGAFRLPVDRVEADPHQPRQEFDAGELEQLAASLRDRGQLQPIRVRWEESRARWVVIDGERRWRAARLAGLEQIDAVEVAVPDGDQILEDQLVANCLRSDLRPIEQARAYATLMDRRGLTQRQLAERLRISQAAVAQACALLALPEPIRDQVEAGRISATTAYELSRVPDSGQQHALAAEAAAGRLRRDQVRSAARPRSRAKRKLTERTYRTTCGPRVTVALSRGLTAELIRSALLDVLGQVEAEQGRASGAA